MPGGRASRFDLVIFDCDGVLIDSEPIANRVLAESLTELGRPTTAEQAWREYGGQTWDACFAQMARAIGRALPDDYPRGFAARLEAALAAELVPIDGIHDALARISTPICVASNGRHETMRLTLAKTGLLDRFQGRIFSADDVPRPKPFPDLYLHAAERLGHAPARCAVIEDSPRGAAAGAAAGMTVFGFAPHGADDRLAPSCAHVFGDMRALPDLLR